MFSFKESVLNILKLHALHLHQWDDSKCALSVVLYPQRRSKNNAEFDTVTFNDKTATSEGQVSMMTVTDV